MTRPIILLCGDITHAQKEWEELSSFAELREVPIETREEFLDDCKTGKYDGVVAIFHTYMSARYVGLYNKELIQALPESVKFICHNGAGYDQIDPVACMERGIQVSNTPEVVNNATANVAMMLMLAGLRRSTMAEKNLRNEKFRGDIVPGYDPEGLTVGIIGMGGIGSAFSVRAKAFEMNIIYHNNNPVSDERNPADAKYVSMDELLETSDVISISCPLNASTRGLIGKSQFDKMKDNVVIINTARGPIIDEQALVDALASGKVFSAGLDVFEKEPTVHPELLKNDNVTLFPHIGTFTEQTLYKLELKVLANIKSGFETGSLITQVAEQRK
ncbi:hypothetical protein NADFUDRAFT_46479 [Nadsonia fulvescens var. elongata DSM 6958]|uniref:Glyoxylate reductase n=1 Tax=Nadsonia fulvescens var. elongata DSM 6958 TaxID=857566 RepID=A0A1E3PKC0_9ASCO|nr:hypothetical protein NADFUDRAFT_46479 [Nadsonia fulvescens var. elongata DSM 6958]